MKPPKIHDHGFYIDGCRVAVADVLRQSDSAQLVADHGAVLAVEAAEALSCVYFEIAADLIGADEVRRIRDERFPLKVTK